MLIDKEDGLVSLTIDEFSKVSNLSASGVATKYCYIAECLTYFHSPNYWTRY